MAALAVLQQVGQEGGDAVDDAVDHHPQAPVPVVVLGLLDRPADADAGVVEQQVDLVEGRHRLLGGAGEGLAVGHVEPDGVDLAGLLPALEILKRGVDAVLADVGHDHLHAGVDEGLGGAEADAGGSAGDEGDLPLDVFHTDRSRKLWRKTVSHLPDGGDRRPDLFLGVR